MFGSALNTSWIGFLYRSSHRRCSIKKGVPENFAKFTERQLCQSLFLDKVIRNFHLWTLNFAKFLSTPFLQNTSGGLLLPELILMESAWCHEDFKCVNVLALFWDAIKTSLTTVSFFAQLGTRICLAYQLHRLIITAVFKFRVSRHLSYLCSFTHLSSELFFPFTWYWLNNLYRQNPIIKQTTDFTKNYGEQLIWETILLKDF